MKAVYTRLTELLGQPPDGIMFNRFVAEVGCEPIIDPPAYTFSTLGVELVVADQLFSVLLMHIDTPSTRQGWINSYECDLPNGIDHADGPETIEQKLSVRPMNSERLSLIGLSPKDVRSTYVLPPLILLFDFAADTQKLTSISISLSPEPLLSGDFQLRKKRSPGS
jgi:hypothetical protein